MGTLLELLNNIETVRTVAGGGFLREKWKKTIETTSDQLIRTRSINNVAITFAQTALQASSAGIVCVGVILISTQSITTGALIACVILSGRILSPLVQIGQLMTRLNSTLIAYKNVDKLIEVIKLKLKNQFIKTENVLITRSRHREHLKQCYKHLNRFLEKKNNVEFDKAAEDLRLSIRHLGTIVGRVDVEEILGSIFENFCIGK